MKSSSRKTETVFLQNVNNVFNYYKMIFSISKNVYFMTVMVRTVMYFIAFSFSMHLCLHMDQNPEQSFLPLCIWTSCVEWATAYHSSIISAQSTYFYTHIRWLHVSKQRRLKTCDCPQSAAMKTWTGLFWRASALSSMGGVRFHVTTSFLAGIKKYSSALLQKIVNQTKLNICLPRPVYESQIASCRSMLNERHYRIKFMRCLKSVTMRH